MSETSPLNYQSAEEKYCRDCGRIINAKAEICPRCGVRQTPPPMGKSKIATAVLALFLGGFGVHRFYLGHIGLGFLYLIFCWSLIPGIIAFIEFIIFIFMSDETFNEKYRRA